MELISKLKKGTVVVGLMLGGLTLQHVNAQVFPGADENTPSRAQYFSWINNLNEGATEEHTRINLDFFKWLKDEYGMQLDIYAFDAGAIDGANFYGSIYSDRFKSQFPNGFDPMYKQAKAAGIRLGVWGGPDGFGNTPEEAKARREQMVKLCKDYEFALFKFDAVCGPLRPEKEDEFIKMMEEARQYSPDLILLNHRLGLKKQRAKDQATTFLWGGQETYIDIHIINNTTAPHHRAGALSRGLPPQMKRLTEDHGVCISSCLDNWDDDLILQAFNRNLILAPEIYGNPWLLNDSEFSKLARIYNLHRKYRNIMQQAIVLPENQYGPSAVSRGSQKTRLVTLRNLTWEPKTYTVDLDKTIGLQKGSKVHVRQFHPAERIVGDFKKGSKVEVEVAPFRSLLLLVTTEKCDEPGVNGVDYQVVRNVPGKPVVIDLLGQPGTTAAVNLVGQRFKSATIEGENNSNIARGKKVQVSFDGDKLTKSYHRKVTSLKPTSVPADAEALYEATVFAADNNAMEVRSVDRSGATELSYVKAARDAFFNQKALVEKGLWDKYIFDNDYNTFFFPTKRKWHDHKINGGCFRLDLGEVTNVDYLTIEAPDNHSLLPLEQEEGAFVEVSNDLKTWKTITVLARQKTIIPINGEVRYVRMKVAPSRISEVKGFKNKKELNRNSWRASNLFAHPTTMIAKNAWNGSFKVDEVANGNFLCVAINGEHGEEGVYATLRVDGKLVGAPDRAVSYPSNVWENSAKTSDSNYTYYFPMTKDMVGKNVEVVVLGYEADKTNLDIEVWQTATNAPANKKRIILQR
ncbi:hypothetical protein EMN47_16910 [Prolixibacteraceae bacterium JC049]|nr:hypothetical protein [Prolixibacteraceae bacterium JC049]